MSQYQRSSFDADVNMDDIMNAPLSSAKMRYDRKRETEAAAAAMTSTPKKTPSKRGGTDRFIPRRNAFNNDVAHFHLADENRTNTEQASPKVEEYTRKLADTLLGSPQPAPKILHFRDTAPAPPQTHQNNLKVLYTQNKSGGKAVQSKFFRHIPTQPEKILDAPDFVDDYYLNLIAWGSNNVLAVALSSALYLWNATTGDIELLFENNDEDNIITSLSWVQEGSYLAVGFTDGDVQLWDAQHCKLIRTMQGHMARVSALDWNTHILTSGSRDTTIVNHDVRQEQHKVNTWEGHTHEICGLKWSPDGTMLASGGNDNLVNLWSLADSSAGQGSSPVHVLSEHQAAVKALAWCPWQKNLLATGGGSADRTMRFWNTTNGVCLNAIDTYSQVTALSWSRYEKEIVSAHGFSQNQLSIWKYPSMVKMADLTGHTSRVLAMAASPDGHTLVSASADETLRFWRCLGANESRSTANKATKPRSASVLNSVNLR